jgi:hypothetical protein
MGTSPPSGHAGLVTENTRRGGAGPRPPAGACAMTTAQHDSTTLAENRLRWITFIRILVLKKMFANFIS